VPVVGGAEVGDAVVGAAVVGAAVVGAAVLGGTVAVTAGAGATVPNAGANDAASSRPSSRAASADATAPPASTATATAPMPIHVPRLITQRVSCGRTDEGTGRRALSRAVAHRPRGVGNRWPQRGVKLQGMRLTPLMNDDSSRSGSPVISRSGKCWKISSNITVISRRARLAPRQKCGPPAP
jgi:hypothetical protein